MTKKIVLVFLSIALLTIVMLNFSVAGANDSVAVSSQDNGVVEKARGDAFTVSITFQNTGRAEGNWSLNVVFEGDSWSWVGASKNLMLSADAKKTLNWNGAVPTNATIGSVARLVVYYDDSFKALDWWIRVVPAAELTIKTSNVT